MTTPPHGCPLIFGEVLFDTFPDGTEVLGGAPFNVAWHLQGFGHSPLFVSRIGRDARGKCVAETMRAWGMETGALQHDGAHPTGIVNVTLNDGQPTFEILREQAYDYIESGPAAIVAQAVDVALVYHGTLALRNPVSRMTLLGLRHLLSAPVCVDVNLRTPWWERSLIEEILQGSDWVKLNNMELNVLTGHAENDERNLEAKAVHLRQGHHIQTVLVTLGSEGAFLMTPDGAFQGAPVPVPELVDTVGAGDAFSAVALLGMLHDWPVATMLERALEFASRICGIRGATISDKDMYTHYLKRWGS